jgi:three-Cys-motif partner protein
VCLLDPYNINLTWEVIEAAGKMGSVELFLNFMIMDVNRNAMRRDPDKSVASKVAQMTRLWGDESWKAEGYDKIDTLFETDVPQKVTSECFAETFRQCLIKKAGFIDAVPFSVVRKFEIVQRPFISKFDPLSNYVRMPPVGRYISTKPAACAPLSSLLDT